MAAVDGMLNGYIPYYGIMKKALPKEEPKKKKVKSHRLTEIDPKTKKPRLKKGVSIERAVEVLYMFENADVMPNHIEDMKQTIENQRQRILKLENW